MELNKLRSMLSEILGIREEDISENSFLVDDLGADSLDLFQLLMKIEEEYDIDLEDHTVEEIFTVRDVMDVVMERTAAED